MITHFPHLRKEGYLIEALLHGNIPCRCSAPLPCAWALSFLGLEYVWFAFPVSNVVSMVLSIVMAKHLFRNYIDPILLDKGEAAR